MWTNVLVEAYISSTQMRGGHTDACNQTLLRVLALLGRLRAGRNTATSLSPARAAWLMPGQPGLQGKTSSQNRATLEEKSNPKIKEQNFTSMVFFFNI